MWREREHFKATGRPLKASEEEEEEEEYGEQKEQEDEELAYLRHVRTPSPAVFTVVAVSIFAFLGQMLTILYSVPVQCFFEVILPRGMLCLVPFVYLVYSLLF